jgi:hypothetical protein
MIWKSILALLTTVACGLPAQAQFSEFFEVGEELVYEVSYLNITLGRVKAVAEPFTTLNGKKVAKVKVFIDSHPNIPFVSLHSIYESWMDTSMTFSYQFNANTQTDDGDWQFDQYVFDYPNNKLTMEMFRYKKKESSKTVEIKKHFNDGSSLLFAARALLFSKKSYRMPTVIMEEPVSTIINFSGKRESTEIDAVSYPVKTVYFNGDADWTGIYGLSGRFEGWFSDDAARVPIKAKMKVYVGSVTLELKSWKRNGWTPPKAS